MTKDEWRTRGKALRKSLVPEERAWQNAALTRAITADPRWQRAATVLLFLSFGSEWETSSLIHAAWAENKTAALTRCLAKHRMQICHYTPETKLIKTHGSLREIAPDATIPLDVHEIDFCLVPGLLFDPYGARLGYGAGYYDRFLPTLPSSCTILACGFDCQLVGVRLPTEDTDFRLPEIWTPSLKLRTRKPFQ